MATRMTRIARSLRIHRGSPIVPSLGSLDGAVFLPANLNVRLQSGPLASYLRTNTQAISYGRAGGIAAPLPREFFFVAKNRVGHWRRRPRDL
jgi:hypothetical protein